MDKDSKLVDDQSELLDKLNAANIWKRLNYSSLVQK